MVILGIDPGYGTIGYGIVRYRNDRFTPIQYGAITTQIGAPMHMRPVSYTHLTLPTNSRV